MNRRLWHWLGALLGAALLAVVLVRLVQYRQQLTLDWRALSWPLLAAALACSCAAQLLFASAWHVLLPDGVAAGWRQDCARWSMSLAGKYLPGKIFQAVLRLGSYRADGGSARIAPAIVREVLLSLGAACAWVALHLASTSAGPRQLFWPMLAAAVILTIAALPVVTRRVSGLVRRWIPRLDADRAPTFTGIAGAWGMQLGGYFLLGTSVWLLGCALAPEHPPGLLAAVGGLCFAGVAGVAAFVVPAGIGVREAALAWYLAAWLPAGPAALLAIAARLCLSAAEFAMIALGLLAMRTWKK